MVIGAVGGPFGVHGWVHVRSFTQPAANLATYRPWQLRRGTDWRTVDAAVRPHQRGFVACIDGCADRDAAAGLRGAEIAVAAELLPVTDADEYYWRDLVGCRVLGEDGDVGTVVRVFETPAHDVLVVEGPQGTDMIPFVPEIVRAVDVVAKTIDANWQSAWSGGA
ncbi:MAG: ribosome maturation factor RimM [Gammaproteobacteria bacterium]|nr:ribosome maturation factor RimM [Gammaproteobacteria bacterium]